MEAVKVTRVEKPCVVHAHGLRDGEPQESQRPDCVKKLKSLIYESGTIELCTCVHACVRMPACTDIPDTQTCPFVLLLISDRLAIALQGRATWPNFSRDRHSREA